MHRAPRLRSTTTVTVRQFSWPTGLDCTRTQSSSRPAPNTDACLSRDWPSSRRGNIRYSATELDARGCESLPVTVVGGANSAGQAALFLASRGSRVDVVIRRPDFSTISEYLSNRLLSHPMVHLWTGSEVTRLHGEKLLTGVGIRTMN